MIEIDDRIVMLLFILFLGYMLFNRREGFNVGGQNLDYNGRCDCLDKSDAGCIKICSNSPSKGVCENEKGCKWTGVMDRLDDIVSIQGNHYSDLRLRVDNIFKDTSNICYGIGGRPAKGRVQESCKLTRP